MRLSLEDRDVAVNLSTMSLRDALGNPDYVAIFLLFELHKSIENAEVKLVQECILHQLHLAKCTLILSTTFNNNVCNFKLNLNF